MYRDLQEELAEYSADKLERPIPVLWMTFLFKVTHVPLDVCFNNIVKSKLRRGLMCIVNAGVSFDASPSATLSKLFFFNGVPCRGNRCPSSKSPHSS